MIQEYENRNDVGEIHYTNLKEWRDADNSPSSTNDNK